MTYYGLTMAAGNLYPNLYASVIFSGMAELPAYGILLWVQVSKLLLSVSLWSNDIDILCKKRM